MQAFPTVLVKLTACCRAWKFNKWSKNFDHRPHRSGRIFHGGKNLMWQHQPNGSAFQSPNNPPKCPSLGDLVPWTHPSQSDQRHLRSIRPFLLELTNVSDYHTDRQTDHATLVCSNRPLSLSVAAMRPKSVGMMDPRRPGPMLICNAQVAAETARCTPTQLGNNFHTSDV